MYLLQILEETITVLYQTYTVTPLHPSKGQSQKESLALRDGTCTCTLPQSACVIVTPHLSSVTLLISLTISLLRTMAGMEFQRGQNCQVHSKQLPNRPSTKTIVKHVQNNYQYSINKAVAILVQYQLSNSCIFQAHSNVSNNIVKLVRQKNCQMQEYATLQYVQIIMIKRTNSLCSKCLHTVSFPE